MDRSKIVAIVTGVISVLLAIAYLLLVQVLDFRGEMQPAPLSQLPTGHTVIQPEVRLSFSVPVDSSIPMSARFLTAST